MIDLVELLSSCHVAHARMSLTSENWNAWSEPNAPRECRATSVLDAIIRLGRRKSVRNLDRPIFASLLQKLNGRPK